MTGAALAAVIGAVLQEWRHTGYLPAAVACADPHPLDDRVLCRLPDGHDGCHAADENQLWIPDTEETR